MRASCAPPPRLLDQSQEDLSMLTERRCTPGMASCWPLFGLAYRPATERSTVIVSRLGAERNRMGFGDTAGCAAGVPETGQWSKGKAWTTVHVR